MEEQTFIQAINIKKIRHLENVEIVISNDKKKHLILTGKNGSGKTSLLEKLAKYISFKEVNYSRLFDHSLNISKFEKAFKETLDPKFDREIYVALQEKGHILELVGFDLQFSKYDNVKNQNFLKIFFETTRKLKVAKSTGAKESIKNNVEDFEKFLAKKKTEQAFLTFEKSGKEKIDEITTWFDHFENKLKYLFEDESLKLLTKRNQDILDFYMTSNHRKDFDFNTLSSGYSSILLILFDIIQQMDNDVSTDYTKEGIVLIDEIETHLHVSLQKKILPFLTGFFPNVQFIVSTHSPFVLQSEPNAVIFDLETKKRYEDFSNYSSESILETFYNMDKFSQSLKDKMHDYEQLLSSNQYKNGKKTEFLALRNMFLNIPDIEIDYWLKDLELKYIHDIKALMQ